MHYFADPGISGVPATGLSGRVVGVRENYPDWYIQARNATREIVYGPGDPYQQLRTSVAAFLANWQRLGHSQSDYPAAITGWVKFTMAGPSAAALRHITAGKSLNDATAGVVRYALTQI